MGRTGTERTISKGNTQFANPRFITQTVNGLCRRLSGEQHLGSLEPARFVERAAHYMVELNMTHPFREGNGRVIRLFLSLLADQAGFNLDMEILQPGRLNACLVGVGGEEQPMCDLIAESLAVFED